MTSPCQYFMTLSQTMAEGSYFQFDHIDNMINYVHIISIM